MAFFAINGHLHLRSLVLSLLRNISYRVRRLAAALLTSFLAGRGRRVALDADRAQAEALQHRRDGVGGVEKTAAGIHDPSMVEESRADKTLATLRTLPCAKRLQA